MKKKYHVSKEFFPITLFTAPIDVKTIRRAQRFMWIPKYIWKDPLIETKKRLIPAYNGGKIEIYILTPKGIPTPMPCLIYYHGGGFVFEGYGSHFRLAMRYAKELSAKVIYVRYRLAPDYPFPYPQEDSYMALKWIHEHAEELKIDSYRIAVAGDSAGGTLSVTSCMMARDRGDAVRPLFQLLLYPWLDGRNQSESYQRYTDVPLWNSTSSKKVTPIINPKPEDTPLAYRSPVEAQSFAKMPPAYIEVAEFDCLHDDGILYAELLKDEGIEVELHDTKGTIHGFDIMLKAPTTQEMVKKRINYMRNMFSK